MPLAFFRIGLFALSHRQSVGRGLLMVAAAILVVPITVALLVTAAVAGVPPPRSAPAKPMANWQVSQAFGCTGFIFEPRRGDCVHFHSGIDLVAPVTAAVYSVLPGVVEVQPPSGYGGGYGIHVLVRHEGATATMYAHLLTTAVATGQQVAAGALIGYEGSTGLSTGPHLHFEVRRSGVPVDPSTVFPSLFGSNGRAPSNLPVGVSPRHN